MSPSKAWFMNDAVVEDQRLPHVTEPAQYVDMEQLKSLTGIEYFQFSADGLDKNNEFVSLKTDRGYTFEDVIEISKDKLPNYEVKIQSFYKEHLHADEEIRFIEAGSGYFDIRAKEDRWIRLKVVKGDLVILPAGIYHRFTVDTDNYIKVRRLFVGEPVWTPINRPAEEHPARVSYTKQMGLCK